MLAAANTFDDDIADIAAVTSAAAPGPFLRNKRTIATVAFIVIALLASFLLFYFVYPLYNPRNTTTVPPPPPLNGSLCRNPDARGCFDYALCIAPGYNRSDLKKPDCLPDPSPCSYQCSCSPSDQLTFADFSMGQYLFLSSNVPLVSGALLLCSLVALAVAASRKHLAKPPSSPSIFLAGSGGSAGDEWQLFAYPSNRSSVGCIAVFLLAFWVALQFLAFIWLSVPINDVSKFFSRSDCVRTAMLDNRYCWTVAFIVPSGFVFLAAIWYKDYLAALHVTYCDIAHATHVEAVLLQRTETKYKGSIIETFKTSRAVIKLERDSQTLADQKVQPFDLPMQANILSFDAFGSRYVHLHDGSLQSGSSRNSDPLFGCVAPSIMSSCSIKSILDYFNCCLQHSNISSRLADLPASAPPLLPSPPSSDSSILAFTCLCQPQKDAVIAQRIIGRNAIVVQVPAFISAFLKEFLKAFYVFQFLCCALWIIDGFVAYGVVLLVLIMFGGAQAAFVEIQSKMDMKNLVDKDGEVKTLRNGSWVTLQRAELLPGDVIQVSTQTPLPADCILLSGALPIESQSYQ